MRRYFPAFLLPLIACGPSFYQAPPSIGNYPERFATKSWDQLFVESMPLDATAPTRAVWDEICRGLPGVLSGKSTVERLTEIDRLLSENRNGHYSSNRANLLNEIRELASSDPLLKASQPYLDWRLNRDTALPPLPPSALPWNMPPSDWEKLKTTYQSSLDERLENFRIQAVTADPLMRPYWQVRHAAFLFNLGRFDEAARQFSEVSPEAPDHPRAEVALLMTARCQIELSRRQRIEEGGTEFRKTLSEARASLEAYISRFPKGRFSADAEGWLGAVAYDSGQLGEAVRHQLVRLEIQPTREITRTVLRECDRIFSDLLASRKSGDDMEWIDPRDEFDAAAIARHPLVVRLFVQHCIDPSAHLEMPTLFGEGSQDRRQIDFLKNRILNPKPFVKASLAVLGKEMMKVEKLPDPITVTLLAWAATEEGEHEQALALLNRLSGAKPTDETLQARGLVLQRLGRHEEAVSVFDMLLKTHPSSPLTRDVPFRRGLSLFKSGQSGAAIAEFLPLAYPDPIDPQISVDYQPPFASGTEVIQWVDSMLQFAPLSELEVAAGLVQNHLLQRNLLHKIIRGRAMAAHRFDIATKYTADLDEPGEFEIGSEFVWSARPESKPSSESIKGAAVNLATQYLKLASSSSEKDKQRIHLDLAKAWLAQRGDLTIPAGRTCYYAASEREKQDLLRRQNALDLGWARESVQWELDHRDEATHALEHAMMAAESKDPDVAAPALELANQCLFRRAEYSLYQKYRAIENDDGNRSAKFHADLLQRFPDSAETKRSVFFQFNPTVQSWMPGDYSPDNSSSAMMNALEGDRTFSNAASEISKLLSPYTADSGKTLEQIQTELGTAKKQLQTLRRETHPSEQDGILSVIDRLDDLIAAASLPGITTENFIHYQDGLHEGLPTVFESLLDFQSRLVKVHTEAGERPFNDTIDGWKSFLDSNPESPKSEAASFRLTRLIARKDRGRMTIAAFSFPDAPIAAGYKRLHVDRLLSEKNPAAVLTAIETHEKRFPDGRYRDDLNLLRAGALTDLGDYKKALSLVTAILDNPSQPDLHFVAGLTFMDITQRLLVPEERLKVVEAVRAIPGAKEKLGRLISGKTFLSRLEPMSAWIGSDA